MYRILRGARLVRERRSQLCHPNYSKPELLATTPNQVWSWDITKLPFTAHIQRLTTMRRSVAWIGTTS